MEMGCFAFFKRVSSGESSPEKKEQTTKAYLLKATVIIVLISMRVRGAALTPVIYRGEPPLAELAYNLTSRWFCVNSTRRLLVW